MTSYFVDIGGNDGDSGLDWANAWETVNKAATTAVAGDDVTFGDGAYDCGAGQAAWNSGSAVGGYITFQAANRRLAEWQSTAGDPLITLTSESYIKFIELSLKGELTTSWAHLYLTGSDHIIFDDCEIYNTSSRGICIRNASDAITILDCDIHNDIGDSGADVLDGIAIGEAGAVNTNILVDGCTIYHTPHSGILWGNVDGLIIQNCIVHDNDSHNVNSQGGDNIIIRDNILYRAGFWDSPGWDDNRGIFILGGANIEIYRNDIYENMGPGISIDDTTPGPVEIYNNTLYDNDQNGVDWGDLFLHDNGGGQDPVVVFKNNIIYHVAAGTDTIWIENAVWTNLDFDYNLYYDSTGTEDIWVGAILYGTYAAYQTAGFEPNSVVSQDPTFTNAGAADFTLIVGSPAINEGTDVGLPYLDTDPDIGAHEYNPGGGGGSVVVVHITVMLYTVNPVTVRSTCE